MFLGQKTNVNEYYNVFDLFLFPSLYEGLGMVMIEAQCSGLTCIASTEVPIIAKVSKRAYFIDLNTSIDSWVNEINNNIDKERKIDLDEIKKSGYDIESEVSTLEDKYIILLESKL